MRGTAPVATSDAALTDRTDAAFDAPTDASDLDATLDAAFDAGIADVPAPDDVGAAAAKDVATLPDAPVWRVVGSAGAI